MNRHDFQGLHLESQKPGTVFTIEGVGYQLLDYIGIKWRERMPRSERGTEEASVLVPGFNRYGLLACDKTIVSVVAEIKINLRVVSFYSRGPSGLYTYVRGTVGDVELDAKARLSAIASRDFIEPIVVGKHLFHIEYSTNSFSLASFEIQ